MDDSDSQTSLTDKEKLQDAEDTIHELQHDLEKLQLDMAEAKKKPQQEDSKVDALKQEITLLKDQHAKEIKSLKEEHRKAIQELEQNHKEELAKQKAELSAEWDKEDKKNAR